MIHLNARVGTGQTNYPVSAKRLQASEFDLLRSDWDFTDDDIRTLVLGAPQLLGLDASDVSSKFAALEASLGSRAAARAEALRKPAALELEVRGSKRGSVAA